MSDIANCSKGAVKKKMEITQEKGKQVKKLYNSAEFSQQDINRIIGIEEKKQRHEQNTEISITEKPGSTNKKEIQGGTTQNLDQIFNAENENNDNVFKPKMSISRTPTKIDSENSSTVPNKRPRSETSPELINTKKQCDGRNILINKSKEQIDDVIESIEMVSEAKTTELHIITIISALEKIDEILKQDSRSTKDVQTDLRNVTGSLHSNLTLLVYKFGLLEKENLILRHKLEKEIPKKMGREIIEEKIGLNNDKQEAPNYKKTYASILSSTKDQQESKNSEGIMEWKTPKIVKKHETIIRIEQINDSKQAIQELRKEINTKNTEGGFKNIKALKNGAVLVESHTKSQQDKLKSELVKKDHIAMREPESTNPMFLITGIEKGFQDKEFIKEVIRLNDEIEAELGQDIEQQMKIIVRKQCRNPMKENIVLQAPPSIAKWFLKKEVINFDLVKVHIKEYFNLAICFKCCGFGHVAKYCTEKECCHKCGGEHTGRDCIEVEWKCPNCKKMKFGALCHSARDINCPVYKRRIERFKQTINYTDSFL